MKERIGMNRRRGLTMGVIGIMTLGSAFVSPRAGTAAPLLTTGSLSASYAPSNAPSTYLAGSSATYQVTVTNTGTATWKPGGQTPVHLSVRFSTIGGGYPGSQPWLNEQRYTLPNQVSPGQTATFSITVTAPTTLGSYTLEYQMILEPSTWFPQYLDSAVKVTTPATATPTATATLVPTSTPTSTPTATNTPTSTPLPTDTPTATATFVPVPTPSPVSNATFSYTSASGDYIGRGGSGTYSASNSTFAMRGNSSSLTLTVTNSSNSADYWMIQLAAPTGEQLHPMRYYDAERAAFKTGRSPGLDVSGQGRGCNSVYGTFNINQIGTDSSGNVTLLDATFSQSCETSTAPPMQGTIHYQSSPLTYSFTSDSGDYIGQGATASYVGATTIFGMHGTAGGLTYSVSGQRDNWTVNLQPPTGQQLQVGTYSGAQLTASTGVPGLNASGDGRGCSSGSGSFTINAIQADSSGNVIALNATFIQYCGTSTTAALHGTINFYA
jgi:hypothetical protein